MVYSDMSHAADCMCVKERQPFLGTEDSIVDCTMVKQDLCIACSWQMKASHGHLLACRLQA